MSRTINNNYQDSGNYLGHILTIAMIRLNRRLKTINIFSLLLPLYSESVVELLRISRKLCAHGDHVVSGLYVLRRLPRTEGQIVKAEHQQEFVRVAGPETRGKNVQADFGGDGLHTEELAYIQDLRLFEQNCTLTMNCHGFIESRSRKENDPTWLKMYS